MRLVSDAHPGPALSVALQREPAVAGAVGSVAEMLLGRPQDTNKAKIDTDPSKATSKTDGRLSRYLEKQVIARLTWLGGEGGEEGGREGRDGSCQWQELAMVSDARSWRDPETNSQGRVIVVSAASTAPEPFQHIPT